MMLNGIAFLVEAMFCKEEGKYGIRHFFLTDVAHAESENCLPKM
jgi:hypothetical protein